MNEDLIYCRIVGNLTQEVNSACGDTQKVLDIGELYYQYRL